MKISSTLRDAAKIEWLFLILGLIFTLTQLALSWNKPILDQYAFRQTQTAISVYWMMKGGAWLAYATPVLGAPWTMPFEFPLYQSIVAITAEHLRFLTLDQAGRVVSETFLLMCLWPLWRIATHYQNGRKLFRVSASLLLFSPIYVFWSRSFMMESTALFLSIWFVAALVDYSRKATALCIFEMTVTGALAACVKITTFVGFSFAGAFIVLWALYVGRKYISSVRPLLPFAGIAASVAAALLALVAWLHFSDALKSGNLFAESFTAEALKAWNFGTLAQRESIDIWRVISERAPNEALGTWWLPAIFSIYAIFKFNRRQLLVYFSLILLYVLPFMVFTNLHLIHHYYQYANSIFLVFAMGFGLSELSLKKPMLGVILLGFFISCEVYGYSRYFYDDMVQPNREFQSLLATYLRSNVGQGQVIVGFGLTWSSEVPYYAERRALLVSESATPGMLDMLSANLSKYTGGLQVGAVIVCPNGFTENNSTKASYDKLLTVLTDNRQPHIVGHCIVYQ